MMVGDVLPETFKLLQFKWRAPGRMLAYAASGAAVYRTCCVLGVPVVLSVLRAWSCRMCMGHGRAGAGVVKLRRLTLKEKALLVQTKVSDSHGVFTYHL